MNIVIATPIVYDPKSPFNHLFGDMIGGFLEAGHSVTRLVAVENKSDCAFKYGHEGEHIVYKLYKRKNSAHKNIISRYIRDTFTSMRQAWGILRLRQADVLFEDASYSSVWPVMAAKWKKLHIVVMAQDVWPDNAVQTGLIREGSFLYRFFEFFQKKVYKRADRVICISEDMKCFMESKGIPAERIDVIYNWGYGDDPVQIDWKDNLFVQKYDLPQSAKYVVYAGNIGRMQNVEVIVEAAKQLVHRKDIRFLIVGDGANREEIERLSEGVENITMLPFQPKELAPHIYSMASVNLAPIVSGGLKTALPSKIGVCLSCGNPLVVCADKGTKLEQMFDSYGCGAVVDTQNLEELVSTVVRFCDETREKNYKCFEENFCRSVNIQKYVRTVQGEKA